MRYRVTFAAGLAAGFVMGTRAGRERYEQLKRMARRAADSPRVQQAAGAAAAQATGLAKTATSKLTDKVQQRSPALADAAKKAGERLPTLPTRVPGWRGKQAAAGNGTGQAAAEVPSVPAPGEPLDT
jgi:hypothetical protein